MTNFISNIGHTLANAFGLLMHGTRGRRTNLDVKIEQIEELQVKLADKKTRT